MICRNLIEAQKDKHELDSQALVRIGEKYVLNGREIKNLLAMSMAVSKSKNIPLNEETIDTVFDLCHKKYRAIEPSCKKCASLDVPTNAPLLGDILVE